MKKLYLTILFLLALNLKLISQTVSNIGLVKNILDNNLRDCSIFVCSDSTGNEKTEWVYRFTNEFLKTKYPKFTVIYHLFDYVNQKYSNTVISNGTGPYTLHIYNSALSGGVPKDFLGIKKQSSIVDKAPYDLLILNHGHNLINYYTFIDDIKETRALLLEFTEEFLEISPNSGVLVFAQNPRRDDNLMTNNYYTIETLCQLRDFGFLDAFSEFMKLSKDSTLYNDNIHPSSYGTDLYLKVLKDAYNYSKPEPLSKPHESIFKINNSILPISKGSFFNYEKGIPEGWNNSGSTLLKDTTIVDPRSSKNYSLKLINGNIYYSFSNEMMKKLNGKTVTLAARIFIPEGEDANTGRIGFASKGFYKKTPPIASGQGGWSWKIITTKLTLANYFWCVIYGSAKGSGSCNVDKIILFEGE